MRVLIITGGETGERSVSLKSAAAVRAWISSFADSEVLLWPEQRASLKEWIQDFDIVIPMIHGQGGEDGELQRALIKNNARYLFSSPHVHEVCLDKKRTKLLVKDLVRVPREYSEDRYHLPMVVKNSTGGSSLNTYIIKQEEDLKGLNLTGQLLEEYVDGREFTVGVIELEEGPVALPVVEIIAKGFFDHQQKYNKENLAKEICPADIAEELTRDLKQLAVEIHSRVGARHLSRIDFLVTAEGEIVFLEINTIPGLTETSLVPKALTVAKIDISALIQFWIDNARKI
jgi:D-alanine-D-alanine ligase